MYYKLVEQTPVEINRLEWADWMAQAQTRIMYNEFNNGCAVSTVFIGVDLSPCYNNPPKLFETLVVGGVLHGKKNHYATYDEAITGHLQMCVLVFKDSS